MEILRALVLGIVQGVTEFLPVSSSGHLLVVGRLFGWPDTGLAFDAALHLGTLLAVLLFFRRTWSRIVRGAEPRLAGLLLLGTLPAGLAGYFGETLVATQLRSVRVVAVFFLVTAGLLVGAERVAALRARRRSSEDAPVGRSHGHELTVRRALLVGTSQVAALLPGLSRSGATIATGMLLGLPRTRAVEYSFLLALPITAAAGIRGLGELTAQSPHTLIPLGVGLLAAFAAGMAAIRALLHLSRGRTFLPFVLYLVAAGGLLLLA